MSARARGVERLEPKLVRTDPKKCSARSLSQHNLGYSFYASIFQQVVGSWLRVSAVLIPTASHLRQYTV